MLEYCSGADYCSPKLAILRDPLIQGSLQLNVLPQKEGILLFDFLFQANRPNLPNLYPYKFLEGQQEYHLDDLYSLPMHANRFGFVI